MHSYLTSICRYINVVMSLPDSYWDAATKNEQINSCNSFKTIRVIKSRKNEYNYNNSIRHK